MSWSRRGIGMLAMVLGITSLASASGASPASPTAPALTCPSATSAGCPETGGVVGGSGAVAGLTAAVGVQTGGATHVAAANLVARTFPPRDVTCCSARLEGAASLPSGPKRIEVSAYFRLERDGGPQPVELYSTTARSTGKPGTYGFYGSFSELPSCSSYRYWIVGREGRERAIGGPESFSTWGESLDVTPDFVAVAYPMEGTDYEIRRGLEYSLGPERYQEFDARGWIPH